MPPLFFVIRYNSSSNRLPLPRLTEWWRGGPATYNNPAGGVNGEAGLQRRFDAALDASLLAQSYAAARAGQGATAGVGLANIDVGAQPVCRDTLAGLLRGWRPVGKLMFARPPCHPAAPPGACFNRFAAP